VKKVIKLTESDLTKLVKRIIYETENVEQHIIEKAVNFLNRKFGNLTEFKLKDEDDWTYYVNIHGRPHFFTSDLIDRHFISVFENTWRPVQDIFNIDYRSPEMEIILNKWLEDSYGMENVVAIPIEAKIQFHSPRLVK
jgi:hypothetical protein